MKKITCLFILLIISSTSCVLYSQQWSNLGKGLEYTVNSMHFYKGNLYAASYGVAVWDGTAWVDKSNGLRALFASGDVYTICTFNDVLYAGGSFTVFTPDNNWYNNAAKFNDGSWTTCGSGKGNDGSGMSDYVNFMVVYDGQLYAGGRFSSAGGDPLFTRAATYIARFDGSEWHPVGGGMDFTLTDMVVFNEELIVSGYFTQAAYLNTAGQLNPEAISANHIAKWNGISWSPLGSGMDGKVTALAVHNKELYAGGSFENAGGVQAKSIAKWNGQHWTSIGNGIAGGGQVYTLASYNNKLYAGGNFTISAGNAGDYIMSWDGIQWKNVGSGTSGSVITLLPDNSGLFVGGNFSTAGSISANNIAKYTETVNGVEDNLLNNTFNIYPNPTIEGFYFSTPGKIATISIYNLSGALELTQQVNGKDFVNVSFLPPSIYLVKIKSADGTIEKKLVKQ